MSPRRKKAAVDEGTPVSGAPEFAQKKSAPKKKAAAKKGPAELTLLAMPTAPNKPVQGSTESKVPLVPNAKPRPVVSIPIKPIPQIGVPPRIVIEPESVPNGETEDLWKPKLRNNADLKQPPKVLLERKKVQKPEIEDILEEPEAKRETDRSELRPVVRTGLYRKIALGFGVLALLVVALVGYVLYAHATVTVFPQKSAIESQIPDLTIAADPQGGDVAGQVVEVTVSGERVAVASGAQTIEGISKGKVTLINETGGDILLVRTTRLLTAEGVLFRLANRVAIPAHGRVQTDMYADKAGAASDIGPSTFSIPGLSTELQKKIYAISDAAVSGGTVSTGVVSSDDVDKTEKALHDDLTQQAKDELAKTIDSKWKGQTFVVETMNRFVSSAASNTAESVTIRLTLRVRGAGFDRDQAIALAVDDLKQKLTAARELLDTDSEHATFTLSDVDAKTGTASLHVSLKGQAQVALSGPSFDPAKLKGKSLANVQDYFQGIEGVEKVDVTFKPFWIKRMPDLPDHITIQINK